jgi:hypothetical protein
MSDTEIKEEVGNSSNSGNPTHEPTIRELQDTIRELRRQHEEVMKRLEDRDRVNRRSTLYVPNTPHTVSGRTSMGGVANLRSSSAAGDDEYEETDPFLEEPIQMGAGKTTTMKVKEPPVFDGQPNSDVKRWLELMEDFMSCFSESEVMKVQKAMMYLGEGPRECVKTAAQEAKAEGRTFYWKDVKKILQECFLPAITEEIARSRLATLKQTGSVWEYTVAFQKLDRYIPNSSAADRIERYRHGLKDHIQRLWLQNTTLQSVAKVASGDATSAPVISKLTQAISYATHLEATFGQYRELTNAVNRNPPSSTTSSYRPFHGSYQQGDQRRRFAGVNQVVINDDVAGDDDHGEVAEAWDELQYQQGSAGRLNQVNVAPPLFRRVRPSKPQGMSEEKYERLMREKRCLMCEQVGHRRRDCPKIQASSSGSAPANSSSKTTKKEDAPRQ